VAGWHHDKSLVEGADEFPVEVVLRFSGGGSSTITVPVPWVMWDSVWEIWRC